MPNYLQDLGLLHLEEGDIKRLGWKKGFRYEVSVISNYYGIAYSYINCHLGNVEIVIKYRRNGDGEEEVYGFDTHCDGRSVWLLQIVKDLTGDGDPLCRKLLLRGKNDRDLFIADVVNADVLPSFSAGEMIRLQMIAYADEIRFSESEEACRENSSPEDDGTGSVFPKDAVCPVDPPANGSRHTGQEYVHVRGTIREIAWDRSFYELDGEESRDFIRCTVKTQYGDLDIVANAGNIDRNRIRDINEKGGFIADCTARLCGDAGIYEYHGILRNKKTNLKLVRYTLEQGDPERLRSSLADDFVYHSEISGKHVETADGFIDLLRQSRAEGRRRRASYAVAERCTKENDPRYPAGTGCLILTEDGDGSSVIFVDTKGEKISRILQSNAGDYRLMDERESSFLVENGVLVKYSGPGGNITIPEGVTEIGEDAFEDCTGLTGAVLPDGLKRIGARAFKNCWNLKDISLPESLTEIRAFAFSYCRSLEEIRLPKGLTTLSIGAFDHCDSLRSIRMPDRLEFLDTFAGCSQLSEITVPEGIRRLSGFEDCPELRRVTLPESLESIHDGTFSRCEKLSEINFPENLSRVGPGAFYGCRRLELPPWIVELENDPGLQIKNGILTGYFGYNETVKIPMCVTGIGDEAFKNTRAWKHVKKVIIHAGVKSIGKHAFDGLPLTGIQIPTGVTSIGSGAFSNCRSLKEITIPGSVTRICGNTFEGCRMLRKAVLSEGVTHIEAQAFLDCSSLEEAVLPKSLESIGDSAFSGCRALETIHIPSGVTNMGTTPFFACRALKNVEVSSGNHVFKCADNVIFTGDGRTLVTCGAIEGRYEIPDGVESIEREAFNYSPGLCEVVCPASVTRIGDRAFSDDYNLKRVILSEGIRSIGEEAFTSCRCLADIALPRSLESLGRGAFCQCEKLTDVVIPDGITDIDEGTFKRCVGLRSAAIPESVRSIRKEAFSGCVSLTEIRFPAGLSRIGEEAFRDCSGLTSVTIPQSVESIGKGAFSCCHGLERMELPDCEGIFQAFFGCRDLKEYIVPEDSEKYKTVDGVVLSRDGKKLVAYPPGRKCARYDIPETVEEVCDHAFVGAPVKLIYAHRGVLSFGKGAAHAKDEGAPFVAYYHAECTSRLGKPIYLGPPEDLSKKKLRHVKEGIRSAMKSILPEIDPWRQQLQSILNRR